MRKNAPLIIGIVLIIGLVFWVKEDGPLSKRAVLSTTQYKTTPLTMAGETFTAQIADTPALQELGLSYRAGISQTDAMIFVFPAPGNYKFWMKDMNFPIDIIWLNSDKKIIHIEKNLSPQTYPNSFGPDADSQFVIEVASGTAERLGLHIGDSISFSCNGYFCARPSQNSTS